MSHASRENQSDICVMSNEVNLPDVNNVAVIQ